MRKTLALTLAAAALVGGTTLSAEADAKEVAGPDKAPRWQTTPCEYEDDWNCFWNAGEAGDGQGHSFWAIPVGQGKVAIVYWNARYNRKHGFITGH